MGEDKIKKGGSSRSDSMRTKSEMASALSLGYYRKHCKKKKMTLLLLVKDSISGSLKVHFESNVEIKFGTLEFAEFTNPKLVV